LECEFCDCVRSLKLPGKPLADELGIQKTRHIAMITSLWI
jgi:hypothetical protein